MEPFRIGLTFAGAVSGGAYTAGVVDFLVEALEAWYAAKEDTSRDDVPRHSVSIDVITGTSAGSVTAALLLAALRGTVQHVHPGQEDSLAASKSLLFDTWVNGLKIDALLQENDLKKESKVLSLLDSTVLDTLGDAMIRNVPKPHEFAQYPAWLNGELQVLFCTTNVHGVPYRITMRGVGFGHDMWHHGDYGRFVYGDTPPSTLAPGGVWVNRKDPTNTPNSPGEAGWIALRETALASSAFPIGLKSRMQPRTVADFNARKWGVPLGPPNCCKIQPIETPWNNAGQPGQPAGFLSVDGGMANNESFELARQILANGPCAHNDRDGETVKRCVVLLDPFLDAYDAQAHQTAISKAQPDILGMLQPLWKAMRTQCRFKREELALAQDETVFSRFLLAPTRQIGGVDIHSERALAAGGLGAFAGFLDRTLRMHDYMLGRHNARKFLLEDFALPLGHSMMKDFKTAYTTGPLQQYAKTDPKTGVRYASIIPVMPGLLAVDEQPPVWPQLPANFVKKVLEPDVKRRLSKVLRVLLDQRTSGGLWLYLYIGWFFGKGKAAAMALRAICCDLSRWGLLAGRTPPQTGSCPGCPYP